MGVLVPVGSEMASKMTDALFGSTADSKRYVRPMLQIGSIVRVNYGEDLNKLATVVDIIDSGRLLVEGPENLTGVPRKVLTIKRMSLTGLGVGITRNARQKQLNKAWKDAGIQEKWDKSAYAKARNSCFPQRFRSLQGHARAQVEVPEACRRCQEDAQVRQVSWTVPWCAAPYTHLASRIQQKNFL